MNSKKKYWFIMIVAMLMMALIVTGCGGDDEEPAEEADAPAAEEQDEAAEEPVAEDISLNFLTLNDEEQLLALETMIAAWKASDPKWANVEVQVDSVPFSQLFPKIEASVAAGADFDAFLADGPDMKHYAYNGAIIPLDEYYTAEELAEFVPQTIAEGSYKGVFYSPAIMQSCSMMFYNADFTDEAGLQPPQEVAGWTMDEAWDAFEKTTVDTTGDGSPEVWGLRWGQGTWWGDYEHGIIRRSAGEKGSPTYEGMGADGISFVGYMDTQESIDSFQMYRDWHIGDRAVSPVEPLPDILESKQAAFQVTPDNRIGSIERLYPDGGFNWGVTGIPYYADGAQICHTGSWHFGVTPGSPNREAAVSLVKFFAGSEGAKIWYDQVQQLPARYDLLNTLPEYSEYPKQMFADGLQTIGEPRIQTPCYTEYQQFFAQLAQDVSQATEIDVGQAVKDAAANMEQVCQKYSGWNE
jgi:ABC-type glycerol-3-phosphate transport system substrate-binding protein